MGPVLPVITILREGWCATHPTMQDIKSVGCLMSVTEAGAWGAETSGPN